MIENDLSYKLIKNTEKTNNLTKIIRINKNISNGNSWQLTILNYYHIEIRKDTNKVPSKFNN